MPARFSITVGIRGFERDLDRYVRSLRRRINMRTLAATRAAATAMRRELRSSAPVRTGALKRSVRVRFRRVGTDAGLAIYEVRPEALFYGRFQPRWLEGGFDAGESAALRVLRGDR